MFIMTDQVVTQRGTVFGDEVLAAAILDRLLHHSFRGRPRLTTVAAVEHAGERSTGAPEDQDPRQGVGVEP